MTQKPVVVTILDNEIQSQPTLTIYHTIVVRYWNGQDALTLTSPMTQKPVVVTILDNEFQSQPSSTIYHTSGEILEGLS